LEFVARVFLLAFLFVLLAIAVRFIPFLGLNFLPHAWHFTPSAASLLFFRAGWLTTADVGAARAVCSHGRGADPLPVALFRLPETR
jgi:hypothetical protein